VIHISSVLKTSRYTPPAKRRVIRAPAFFLPLLAFTAAFAQAPGGPTGDAPLRPLTIGKQPDALDLNRCYLLALHMSESDRIRAQELKIAESRYRRALGSFVPEIGLFAEKTWRDRIGPGRDPAVNPTESLVNPGLNSYIINTYLRRTPNTNPFLGGASLRLPLFNGFRTYHESRARGLEIRGRRLERRRFREILYQDVADIFFQVLQYEKSLEVLADEERALRGRIAEIGRYVRLGRLRRGELLVARSDLTMNRVERELAKGMLASSRELLAFLIGRPANSFRLVETAVPPTADALEGYLHSVGERKDILAMLTILRSQKERLYSARSGHLPTVTLEGNYHLGQRPDTGRDWNIYLRIELPLFQAGRTRYEVDEARALVRTSELELKRLRRTAVYEVRMAYNDFISSSAQVLLLREAVRLSRAAYAAQVRDFRHGIVRNLETLEALRRLHRIRRTLVRTEMTAKINRLRLHIAAGRNPP